jgi:mercuric ion binding protein
MKRYWLTTLLALILSQAAWAAGRHYEMRVDGLACPYCAYGIEKKFKAIDGVEKIHVDLDKGLVSVDTREETKFTDEQMKALFKDAGFTFRSMKETPR